MVRRGRAQDPLIPQRASMLGFAGPLEVGASNRRTAELRAVTLAITAYLRGKVKINRPFRNP